MAKFLTKAGLIIETEDKDKIECLKSKGLREFVEEPQPIQDVEVASDYAIRPAVKKKKPTKRK